MQPVQALEYIAEYLAEQYDDEGDYSGGTEDSVNHLEDIFKRRGLLAECDICYGLYATTRHNECPNEHDHD